MTGQPLKKPEYFLEVEKYYVTYVFNSNVCTFFNPNNLVIIKERINEPEYLSC